MTAFTTSAKVIQYYSPSPLVAKLAAAVGDRCERLTQSERYHLVVCLSSAIHAYTELGEGEEQETLIEHYHSTVSTVATANVVACLAILNTEALDTIACILPALTEYAQNDYHDDSDYIDYDGPYLGNFILEALVPAYREFEAKS